jgi:hypothetical protein
MAMVMQLMSRRTDLGSETTTMHPCLLSFSRLPIFSQRISASATRTYDQIVVSAGK